MADRTVTVSWDDPTQLAERAPSLSGLEFLRAIVAGELPPAPIQQLLGFRLVEAEEGRVVFELDPGERHSGGQAPLRPLRGLPPDESAVHSTLPQGTVYVTLEVKLTSCAPSPRTPVRSARRAG
jgi:hypothetical protein